MAPLLGALFAVFVGMLAIRPYLSYQRQSFEMVQAANTASQFRQMINAATIYIQDNCLSGANNGSLAQDCSNISVSQLQAAGLLPSNIMPANNPKGLNPYGQQWNITVSQVSNPGNPQAKPTLQAFLYSSGGIAIPPQLAPQIAAETGQEGGFVPNAAQYAIYNVSANTAVGAYGHWAAPAPASATPGHLVALLNVGNGQNGDNDNDYLYRTVVPGDNNNSLNTMRTSLNMGGNDIDNAQIVNAATVNASQTIGIPAAAQANSSQTQYQAEMVPMGNGGEIKATDGPVGSGDTAALAAAAGQAELALGSVQGSASGSSQISGLTALAQGGKILMEADASDSSIFDIAGTSSSVLNLEGNGAELAVGGTGNNDSPLAFISAPQVAGATCTQLGEIAPDSTGTGMPVVCYQANTSTSAVWRSLGVDDFTKTQQYGPFYPNTTYAPYTINNNSENPMFLSTSCVPQYNPPWGGADKFYVTIQVQDSNGVPLSTNTARQFIPTATNTFFGGINGSNAPVAPYVSAIVPPGDKALMSISTDQTWAAGSAGGSCYVTATY